MQAVVHGMRLSRRYPPTKILPHMAVPRHPPAGPVCLVFWADRGPGASCPYGEGPPARFGDFPAVESHAGARGRSAPKLSTGTLRCKPPQAALRPGWRSAPKLSAGTLRCKPLPGGALHVFGFHLRKERSPMQRIIRLPSSFTVIRETLPAPPHSSQVFRLSTGKH